MISDDIYNQIQSIRQMQMEPHRVYIGRETEYELKKELNFNLFVDEKMGMSKTIYGIPYFIVNTDEHLDVTMKIPF